MIAIPWPRVRAGALAPLRLAALRTYLPAAVGLYLVLIGALLVRSDFLPYVTDNNESFSVYTHARNILKFGIGQAAGLTDEAYSNRVAAHPYVYTHEGNFPRWPVYFLMRLGVTSIEWQIALHALILGALTMYLCFRFFSKAVGEMFAFVTCAVFATDYLLFMQWEANTFRVWHGVFFFLGLVCVQAFADGARRRVGLVLFLTAVCLFYFEIVFALFTAATWLCYAILLYWQRRELLLRIFLITVGGALMAVFGLLAQSVTYLGWPTAWEDIRRTFLNRNFFAQASGQSGTATTLQFFQRHHIVYWLDNPNTEGYLNPWALLRTLGSSVFRIDTPYFVLLGVILTMAWGFRIAQRFRLRVRLGAGDAVFPIAAPAQDTESGSSTHHGSRIDNSPQAAAAQPHTRLDGYASLGRSAVIALAATAALLFLETLPRVPGAGYLSVCLLMIAALSYASGVAAGLIAAPLSILAVWYFVIPSVRSSGPPLTLLVLAFATAVGAARIRSLREPRQHPEPARVVGWVRPVGTVGARVVGWVRAVGTVGVLAMLLYVASSLTSSTSSHLAFSRATLPYGALPVFPVHWVASLSTGSVAITLLLLLFFYVEFVCALFRSRPFQWRDGTLFVDLRRVHAAASPYVVRLSARSLAAIVLFVGGVVLYALNHWRVYGTELAPLWLGAIEGYFNHRLLQAGFLGTIVLAIMVLVDGGRRYLSFQRDHEFAEIVRFLAAGGFGFVLTYLFFPGYLGAGYLSRYAPLPVFFVDVWIAAVFYMLMLVAAAAARCSARKRADARVPIVDADAQPASSLATPRLVFALSALLLIFVAAYWARIQIVYVSTMPPTSFLSLRQLGTAQFRDQTLISNTYSAPFAYYTRTWAYADETIAQNIFRPKSHGLLQVSDGHYLWEADRATNRDYLHPRYYVCFVPQTLNIASEVLSLRAGDHLSYCSSQPIVRDAREHAGPFFNVLIARDPGPADAWAIVKLDPSIQLTGVR